jgi:dTDP-4-dehydrorhamnose reductase
MTKRMLILGGQGMLGHKLWQTAHAAGWEAWATVRRTDGPLMVPSRALPLPDVADFGALRSTIMDARPAVVVNCIGVVKQLSAAKAAIPSLTLNSLLPHHAAAISQDAGARFIHVSTDCVFTGDKGSPYLESDVTDAQDLYGRSKLLGEVGAPALTLRTSIIGRELSGAHGLVEWFLAQSGRANGYRRAVFSGLSTLELSRVILHVAERHPEMAGLYQVAAAPIDKFTLLGMLAEAYGRDIVLSPVDEPVIDRSLDGSRFSADAGWRAPEWPAMIQAMAADSAGYDKYRSGRHA